MNEIREALERMKADAAILANAELVNMDDEDVVAYVKLTEDVGRYVDAARVLGAGEIAERSAWELGSAGLSLQYDYRFPDGLIQHLTRVRRPEALRRMRLGESLRMRPTMQGELLEPLRPQLATAVRNGEVGVEAASIIVASLNAAAEGSAATPDNMEAAERELVKVAQAELTDDVAIVARQWRHALDPDGAEPRHEDIRRRRQVIIHAERNGITRHIIDSGPVLTAYLRAIFDDGLDPDAGPRFLSEEDRQLGTELIIDANGNVTEAINDPRTLAQKRADILEGVLAAGLRATREGTDGNVTIGQVIATIPLSDLKNGTGVGTLVGSEEEVPAKVVQQLVCDLGYYPIVVDDTGFPLYHGQQKRSFTAAQRRAMIARDGDMCVGLGCHRPASHTQAHHVTFFSTGGKTDIDDGVLMCPSCHHSLHSGAFELKMVDGHPWIRAGSETWDESAWRPASKRRPSVTLAS